MYDLTAGKHTKLRTNAFSAMLEVGMGCDLYLPFFKLIPELKFCFGLGNILRKNRNDLTVPTHQEQTHCRLVTAVAACCRRLKCMCRSFAAKGSATQRFCGFFCPIIQD